MLPSVVSIYIELKLKYLRDEIYELRAEHSGNIILKYTLANKYNLFKVCFSHIKFQNNPITILRSL